MAGCPPPRWLSSERSSRIETRLHLDTALRAYSTTGGPALLDDRDRRLLDLPEPQWLSALPREQLS